MSGWQVCQQCSASEILPLSNDRVGRDSSLAVTHIFWRSPRGHLWQRVNRFDREWILLAFVPAGTAECSHWCSDAAFGVAEPVERDCEKSQP